MFQYDNNHDSLPIREILNKLYELFEEEDKYINSQIPNGVETVKIGVTCPFSSEKILSSLIKIGIPIEISVSVLEKVILEITSFIKKTKHYRLQILEKLYLKPSERLSLKMILRLKNGVIDIPENMDMIVEELKYIIIQVPIRNGFLTPLFPM